MMGVRCGRVWHSRIATWVASLAICLATAATNQAPPPIDAAMVERAVAGAEWLAERAAEAPERGERAANAVDLTDWLLAVSGADTTEYEAFTAYLMGLGYDDPLFAVQIWLEEFSSVLTAAEAARRSAELRSLRDIQAEIRTLPVVSLDEAGEAERDRLIDELALAVTFEEDRQAAAEAGDRIDALQAMFTKATDQ